MRILLTLAILAADLFINYLDKKKNEADDEQGVRETVGDK